MIHIIISIDPSTSFLFNIVNMLKKNLIEFNLIEIHPNDDSYRESLSIISEIADENLIIFLGHGQENLLYGGEDLDLSYEKKVFINLNEMRIFKNKYLFLLACNSSDLIKSSFYLSQIKQSIGFGILPTDIKEIESDRKLSSQGITYETIEYFKECITEIVSKAFIKYLENNDKNFIELKNHLSLLLDISTNNAILQRKDRNLADLLYNMKTEMCLYY